MARTQKLQAEATAKPKTPDFIAWNVQRKGDKGIWNRVGASWLHHDGNGMTLLLESVPVDGRVVLRTPREEMQDRAAA